MVPKLRFNQFTDGWYKSNIGNLYKNLRTGQTPSRSKPEYFKGDIPWITSGELNNGYVSTTLENITEEGRLSSNLKIYKENTFFIAITGLEAPGTRGKCAMNSVLATTNQSCLAFEEIDHISNLFLFYWYSTFSERLYFKYAQGTKQQSFNNKIVEDFKFSYPSKEEQNKIALFLSCVDEKISQLEKKKTLLETYKRGIMQKIFSQELRFPGFSSPWKMKTLGDIGQVKMCKRVFNNQTTPKGEIPFYKIGTFGKTPDAYISRSLYNTLITKYSYPKTGDILISASGTLGRKVVYDGTDAYYQDSNIVWIENDQSTVLNTFLFYLYDVVKYEAEGSTIKRLYNNIIMKAMIIIPEIKEQKKITSFLSSIDKKIKITSTQLEKTREFKKGLLQQMFV